MNKLIKAKKIIMLTNEKKKKIMLKNTEQGWP